MASSPIRIGDLEIIQDLATQNHTWIIQRIGWGGMALIVIAALTGVFGSGPLARTEVTDDQHTLRLSYDRFGRYEGELFLQLVLSPETTKTDRVTVAIDRTYWTNHAVEQIIPEPLTTSIRSDGFVYTFEVNTPSIPAMIAFRLRPKHLGALDGRIRINDASSLRFHQFIFP